VKLQEPVQRGRQVLEQVGHMVVRGNGLRDVEQRQVGLERGVSGVVHVRTPAIPRDMGYKDEVSGPSSHAYPELLWHDG
jgi:hypothetical protein